MSCCVFCLKLARSVIWHDAGQVASQYLFKNWDEILQPAFSQSARWRDWFGNVCSNYVLASGIDDNPLSTLSKSLIQILWNVETARKPDDQAGSSETVHDQIVASGCDQAFYRLALEVYCSEQSCLYHDFTPTFNNGRRPDVPVTYGSRKQFFSTTSIFASRFELDGPTLNVPLRFCDAN